MKISKQVKQKIVAEFNSFKDKMYAGKTKEERQNMGQFFTPPELTIKILEQYEDNNGTILDPTMGAGNLLVAAYFAGFNWERIYGVELDEVIMDVAKERFIALGCPAKYFENGEDNHFHIGDALNILSYDFPLHKGKISKFFI